MLVGCTSTAPELHVFINILAICLWKVSSSVSLTNKQLVRTFGESCLNLTSIFYFSQFENENPARKKSVQAGNFDDQYTIFCVELITKLRLNKLVDLKCRGRQIFYSSSMLYAATWPFCMALSPAAALTSSLMGNFCMALSPSRAIIGLICVLLYCCKVVHWIIFFSAWEHGAARQWWWSSIGKVLNLHMTIWLSLRVCFGILGVATDWETSTLPDAWPGNLSLSL